MIVVGKVYSESSDSLLFITPLKGFPLGERSLLEICLARLSRVVQGCVGCLEGSLRQ